MRQKEHIEELKQRIAEFEKNGVEATIAVQQAARRVAQENRVLRDMLELKGVSNEEIESFMRNSSSSSSSSSKNAFLQSSQRSSTLTVAIHPPASNTGCCSIPITPQSVASPESNQESISTGTIYHSAPLQVTTITSPVDFGTPCDQAADLLVSMRGVDREQALAELGCSGRQQCFIKNTELLEILDA
jgi:hypothetical protein